MGRVVGRIGGIAACGGVGAFSAWALVAAAGWTGTAAAIAAVIGAMLVASAAWVAGTVALRALGLSRSAAEASPRSPGG